MMDFLSNAVSKAVNFNKPADIHIAVFGDKNAGKTVLLATFYGYQNSQIFKTDNGYKLLAKNTNQSEKLLNTFHGLERNQLPLPTKREFEEFNFDVMVDNLDKSAGNVTLYDYPGEWWSTTPSTSEEINRRKAGFKTLVHCDIALFLLDGARFKKDKNGYVPKLFKQFTDELERQKKELNDEAKGKNLPSVWVICLTKSDLFEKNYTAQHLKNDIHGASNGNMRELKGLIEHISNNSQISFGEHYLLLSSAEIDIDENNTVKNFGTYIGLDLIAPIAVKAPLEHLLGTINRKKTWIAIIQDSIEITRSLSTKYLSWVPIIGTTFDKFDRLIMFGVDELQKKRDKALKNKNAVDFVVSSFLQKIRRAESIGTYISRDINKE